MPGFPSWERLQGIPLPLQWSVVAAGYVALGWLARRYLSLDGQVGLFWPAAGWALAALLIGGRRQAVGVAGGVLAFMLLVGAPWLTVLLTTIGSTGSALLGHWLLTRDGIFSISLERLRDYRLLLFRAALLSPVFSAVIGIGAAVSYATPDQRELSAHLFDALLWWGGDALGILLFTPLLLNWATAQPGSAVPMAKRLESLLVLLLTLAMGHLVFLNGWPEFIPSLPRKGYLLFPLAVWAASRLDAATALLVLNIVAAQVMAGIDGTAWFFSANTIEGRLFDSLVFLGTLSLVAITLALHAASRRNNDDSLRIAAAAFDCQEGMIVTDARQRILRVNRSFTRIMGYEEAEVRGQTTAFMRSPRHPASFYEAAWRAAREQGQWADEVWQRRKNGEVFPQWLTITAVRNRLGELTHFVVTHTDISERKEREARLQAQQAQQRNALVREVHHRIKNHLQGITGLLRQYASDHPQLAEPLQQAVAQVRSIAVIHGLQGSSPDLQVRLCELTPAIAQEVGHLWQASVRVDRPTDWVPCLVAEAEAVPLALLIGELVTNAIKHAEPRARGVDIRLRKGERPDQLLIRISNPGHWRPSPQRAHGGLQLIEAMLPPAGARLQRTEEAGTVHTTLTLEPPVIALDHGPTDPAPDDTAAHATPAAGR